MGDKKDEDLYCNFTRKDLQGLCKKYDLPANRTNSEMASSLILFLERRNLASKMLCKGTKSVPCASSSASEMQLGAWINSAGDERKDCFENGSANGRYTNPQDVLPSFSHDFTSAVTSDKAWMNKQNLPQLQQRDSKGGACLPENAFSSVVDSSIEVSSPTLQFDVSSEYGIHLYVDLHSSPSKWVENMKSGVHICYNMYKNNPQSFHQELKKLCCLNQMKGSFLCDIYSDHEINDSHGEDDSYPTTVMKEGGQVPIEYEGEGCIRRIHQ